MAILCPYKWRVVLALILLCIGSATILMVPLAFRDLIDFGFGQKQSDRGRLMGQLSLNGHFATLFFIFQSQKINMGWLTMLIKMS